MTRRIDQLNPTVSPERDHEFPAMRDGITVKLRAEQILAVGGPDDPQALKDFSNVDPGTGRTALGLDERYAQRGSNLGDLDDAFAARSNLGLGTAALLPASNRLRGAPIIITESGTYTPDPEVKAVWIEVQGAGGAGAGAQGVASGRVSVGAGGGAGGYCAKFIADPQEATIVIGSGGSGASAANGGSGGTSSYDDGTNTLTANGGSGGSYSSSTQVVASAGANGGSADGGDINVSGYPGGSAHGIGADAGVDFSMAVSGFGGNSRFGRGGRSQANASSSAVGTGAQSASGFGAGGGGPLRINSGGAFNGGNGADGVVIIWEFI